MRKRNGMAFQSGGLNNVKLYFKQSVKLRHCVFVHGVM